MPDLTPRQLEVLQHALGVDNFGRGEMYRTHFCASGTDEDTCRELVALGYMTTFTRTYLPYYNCTVTESGKKAMLRESPKPPRLTRGQRRYRRYLNWKDAWGGSFREFIDYEKSMDAEARNA